MKKKKFMFIFSSQAVFPASGTNISQIVDISKSAANKYAENYSNYFITALRGGADGEVYDM